jgi:hypothetical protein
MRLGPSGFRLRVLLPIAAMLTLGLATLYLCRPRAQPPSIAPTSPRVGPRVSEDDQIVHIYRESIVPLLDDFNRRNQAAAVRALALLHARIDAHRAGIQPFAEDITSWGTRFGLIRRYPSDLWDKWWHDKKDANRIREYVNTKFREHILSEAELQKDVADVVGQFNDDMSASRNRLYEELVLPLGQINTARTATAPGMQQFQNEVQGRMEQISEPLASDTLVRGLVSLVSGAVATDLTEGLAVRIVTQILTALGAEMAVEVADAGGATVAGTAVGGGAGSFGGPATAVIGAGVGFVVGVIVDWWLTDKFRAKVAEQCNRFLDQVDGRLAEGTAQSPGLGPAFTKTVRLIDQAQREAILQSLKENQR